MMMSDADMREAFEQMTMALKDFTEVMNRVAPEPGSPTSYLYAIGYEIEMRPWKEAPELTDEELEVERKKFRESPEYKMDERARHDRGSDLLPYLRSLSHPVMGSSN